MTTVASPPLFRTSSCPDSVRAAADEIIDSHPAHEPFSARNILQQHPWMQPYATIIVDLAYEEFCRRTEAGEVLDPKGFSQGFSNLADPVYRQLLFHYAMAEPAPAVTWPEVGQSYLHFELIQLLGEGGASRVYLVRDHHLQGRARVLKLTRSSAREALSLSRLKHPAIVDALYCESDPHSGLEAICLPMQGRWTLQQVMTLLQNAPFPIRCAADLWQRLADCDETPEWARLGEGYLANSHDKRTLDELFVAWARQLISGLAHAHDQGFLHCDIKPSNILIAWNGEAILLDFDASLSRAATESACGGTLSYMAPEQLRILARDDDPAECRLEPATDLYCWALTFFELLTGETAFPPVHGSGDLQTIARTTLKLRADSSDIPAKCERLQPRLLARCLGQCLEPEFDRRPPSARAVGAMLDRYDSLAGRLKRRIRQHPGQSLAVGVLSLALIILLATGLRADPQRDAAAGNRALAAGDLSQAFQLLSRAVHRQPDLVAARCDLVKTLLRQGQPEEALLQLDHLEESDWERRCRAYAWLSAGRTPETGIDYLRPIIDAGRARAADYNNAAFGLLKSKDPADVDQAEVWLRKAIDLDSSDKTPWANLLIAHRRRTSRLRTELDAQLIATATIEGDSSPVVLAELALTWALVGRTVTSSDQQEAHAQKVLTAARKAIALHPDLSLLDKIEVIWPLLKEPVSRLRSEYIRTGLLPVGPLQELINPAFDE